MTPTDPARRRLVLTGAAASTALLAPWLAAPARAADAFPTRTVRLVVPFPPGGATDALARQIAEQLAKRWQQTVLVDNRPGGNTMIGTEAVARSAPDGHTLAIVTGSHIINPLLTDKMPYDTQRDLKPVMLLTRLPMALYAHPSFPANDPAELVALARKDPGKIAYAYATTQSLLGMELFDATAGIKLQGIPYKGSAQALTDLIGGHVSLLLDPLTTSAVQQAATGKLKIIATMGAQPTQLTPQVPSASKVAPGYDFSATFGLVTQGGTPDERVQRLRDDFAAVLAQPEVLARIREIGQEPVASTPQAYAAYIVAEKNKWEPIVRATGAKLD